MILSYNRQFKPKFEQRARIDPDHPLSLGLVGYWLFNETAGDIAYDISGRNNHGSLVGAIWTTGRAGRGLHFDGSEYVLAKANEDFFFRTGDNWSVVAWVKLSTGSGMRNIARVDSGSYQRALWLFRGNAGKLQIQFGVVGQHSTISNKSIGDNQWHFVAGVVNAILDKVYLYIDGILDIEETDVSTTWDVSNNPDELSLGCYWRNGSPDEYFVGWIDQVQIYRRALTQSEILWLYERPYDNIVVDPIRKFWLFGPTILSQSAYRFYNDDGDEDESTPRANENTGITYPRQQNIRIRLQVDATGDPESGAYELQYRYKPPSGSFGPWRRVES